MSVCTLENSQGQPILLQLSLNEDFSFVRFLKVVKTLYESSTFTQLGRTVGSALGPNALSIINSDSGVNESEDDGREGDDRLQRSSSREGTTFFDALVDACTPGRKKSGEDFDHSNTLSTLEEEKKLDELAPHEVESLFERVINCTLLGSHEDDDLLSCDDDTFRTQTYDEHSMEESYNDVDSYDLSEEDYRESRRSRRRSRRSRRRR